MDTIVSKWHRWRNHRRTWGIISDIKKEASNLLGETVNFVSTLFTEANQKIATKTVEKIEKK